MPNYISVVEAHKEQVLKVIAGIGGLTIVTYPTIKEELKKRGIDVNGHDNDKSIPNGHVYYPIRK